MCVLPAKSQKAPLEFDDIKALISEFKTYYLQHGSRKPDQILQGILDSLLKRERPLRFFRERLIRIVTEALKDDEGTYRKAKFLREHNIQRLSIHSAWSVQ
jgi:hypothetical protein